MSRVLIVGAGGVGGVVTHKCAQAASVFEHITLASRTLARCEKIRQQVKELQGRDIEIAQVDADNVPEMVALIRKVKPDLVLNVALPYQDLPIMDACLEAGVPYLDTANYEPRDVAKFEYKWQWAYRERYEKAGLMALLGSGFDPGVTNVFCAYAQKHYFDEIHSVDIVDCNAGSHGKAFATNFNPEINLREVTQNGRYWEKGQWIETKPMEISEVFDFPGVGDKKAYLIYHEELESLVVNIKGLKRIRKIFIYNVCDHAECYKEVRAQAISYTTAVPAMIGAMMMVTGKWKKAGVVHMEQMDPDPFLEQLAKFGLPWHVKEL
ncbi:MAG: saccharopine dehydrogenase family protein [Proteobacteria bacterium]|nr:saccharopine dehydrogenase family protein [Pseudomonadota bacterium]